MKKSGHTDVKSSKRMCEATIEDAEDIIRNLPRDKEASLPTWWTNKLAICSAYMNSLRDYLVYQPDGLKDMDSEEEEDDDESDIEEDDENEAENNDELETGQVRVGSYTSQHFDICPSAFELYSNILTMTPMIHLVVESMMLQDLFFSLEKKAIAMGSIDQDMVDKAQHYANMIMSLAKEMGLEEEHSYIETIHMAKFKELATVETSEDEDDMLPPSARMMKNAAKKG